MNIAMNTPLWQLTVGEFLELQKKLASPNREPVTMPTKNLIYGIAGLADFLKCSKATAQKIKSSGRIDKAISQCGRKIVIDGDMVIEILKEEQK